MPNIAESSIIERTMEQAEGVQVHIDITTEKSMDSFIEETTWAATCNELHCKMKDKIIKGGVFVHPGTTFTNRHRVAKAGGNKDLQPKVKHAVRRETALALRFLTLVNYLITYSLPFLLIMPAFTSEPTLPITILQQWDEMRRRKMRTISLDYEGGKARGYTNIATPETQLNKIITMISQGADLHRITKM